MTCGWATKSAGEGFKGSLGRRGAFKASLVPLLSETRRIFQTKRPAGGQRTCCWAAKSAGKGFKGSLGRRGALKASLVPLLSETRRKFHGKRPAGGQRTCCWAAKSAGKGFKGSLGRRGAFKASLVPNVAFWNQEKVSRKAPGRWPNAAGPPRARGRVEGQHKAPGSV